MSIVNPLSDDRPPKRPTPPPAATPQPIGILYHGPANGWALDQLAEILASPQARAMPHAVLEATETLYMARATEAAASEIDQKLKASKYAHFFDLADRAPTKEQLYAAAKIGPLPILA